MTTSPTLNEFLDCVRFEFGFLVNNFEFSGPDPLENGNPFGLQYQSQDLRISVEGINWGFGVQILLTPITCEELQPQDKVPLWAILRLVAPSLDWKLGDQLDQVRLYARSLRHESSEILAGNTEIFVRARELMEKAVHDDHEDA